VNEIAGLGARGEFAVRAPTDFAYTRQHICDGLLLAMMVNSVRAPGLALKQTAPQRRFDAKFGRNSGQALRAGRLQSALIELRKVNNTDCRGIVHQFNPWLSSMSSRFDGSSVLELSRKEPILYPALVESGRGLVVRTETLVCAKRLPQFWDERLLDMGEKGHPARPR
jgi:hypothetical protein